ncbi:nucleoside recognition domain-containing protein [Oleispirillum naphthae]|uniref:nucleoside recognition domain-containing protein n=1 Tax=Oleispirillum naphthae TaxID=2838853 RepID=UPI0030825DA1
MNEDDKERKERSLGILEDIKVPLSGYIALICAILIFSGIFAKQQGWLSVIDFNTLNGHYGAIAATGKATFRGSGGNGARDGFLFAISLVPAVMLALGIVEVVDHLGGLRAGQKLLTPILRPLMGIPGIAGLALVTSLQSTDAGAGMTKMLREEDFLTEDEKTIFCAFQFSAGGTITNYLSSGAALFGFMTVPIIVPLALMFILKIFGANLMRMYLRHAVKEA